MFDTFWWITAAMLFLGCTVQTAIGFGMALITAPIIVLFRPEWVPVIMTIVALMLSIQNSFGLRKSIQWKHISPAMISRLPGTVIGAGVLTVLPVSILQASVAGMVFVAIFVTLFAKPFPATIKNLSIAGLLSGIAGTTTSIGGPPMALVMQHGAGHVTRANLSIYFLYSCVVSLISYQLIGIMNTELWLIGLSFLPFALAGYHSGRFARPWVDQRFRPILLLLCAISATVALVGSFNH